MCMLYACQHIMYCYAYVYMGEYNTRGIFSNYSSTDFGRMHTYYTKICTSHGTCRCRYDYAYMYIYSHKVEIHSMLNMYL